MDSPAGTTRTVIGVVVSVALAIAIIYMVVFAFQDYSYSKDSMPWLIQDTRIARKGLRLPGSMIPQSNDSKYGLEFSYSCWIYINEWSHQDTDGCCPTGTKYRHVMHKGSNEPTPVFQAPGIYLDEGSNKIVVKMNTYEDLNEQCSVDNIPVGKWVCFTMVVINRHVDLYVNGRLANRCELKGIPKQNVGDVFITQQGGFDGFLSRFRYYNYALPYWKIEQIFKYGPSDKPCVETGVQPPYLANSWWFSQ